MVSSASTASAQSASHSSAFSSLVVALITTTALLVACFVVVAVDAEAAASFSANIINNKSILVKQVDNNAGGLLGSSMRRNINNNNGDHQRGRWLKESSPQQQQRRRRRLSQNQNQNERNLQEQSSSSTSGSSAMESCLNARNIEEDAVAGSGSVCSCSEMTLDERYGAFIDISSQPTAVELECVDARCSYCSPDGSTCDRFSYGAVFRERDAGVVNQLAYFETNQYIAGRPEAVVYTEYVSPDTGRHSCSMDIDGLRCKECEYISCGGDSDNDDDLYYGLRVTCSNIMIGNGSGGYVPASDFSTCDPAQIEAIGATQGVFEMYDENYGQCFSSMEACERDKSELEREAYIPTYQGKYYSCYCNEVPPENGGGGEGKSPFLENVVLTCYKLHNEAGGVACDNIGEDNIVRTYSGYAAETFERTIKYYDNYSATVKEFDCETTAGATSYCKRCEAYVNGKLCDSCQMEPCGDDDNPNAKSAARPRITCGNVDPELAATVNLCRNEPTTFASFSEYSECGGYSVLTGPTNPPAAAPPPSNQPPSAAGNGGAVADGAEGGKPAKYTKDRSYVACEERMKELQSGATYIDAYVMKCECYDIKDDPADQDEGSLLRCTTNGGGCGTARGGAVCNQAYGNDVDDGSCFRETLTQGFLVGGKTTPLTRTTTYTRGSDGFGNVMLDRTLTLVENTNIAGEGPCEFEIDGVKCNSCRMIDCNKGRKEMIGFRPAVDCTNIVEDESLSIGTCDQFASYEDGLLLRLAAHSDAENPYSNFQTCFNPRDEASSLVDTSKPDSCQKAKPLALPSSSSSSSDQQQQEQQLQQQQSSSEASVMAKSLGFITFVSSTDGVDPTTSASGATKTCSGRGNDSPSLWYGLIGIGEFVRASVCKDPKNFNARVSVYEGGDNNNNNNNNNDCENLTCVDDDDNNDSCEIQFFAEKGAQYYLRVHGNGVNESGTFHLIVDTMNDDTFQQCKKEGEGEEGSNNNNNLYDKACIKCLKEESIMMSGNDKSGGGDYFDCQCLEDNRLNNPNGYHLTCVNTGCLKCNIQKDTCGFSTYELDIDERGTTPAPTYDSFYFLLKPDGTTLDQIAELSSSKTCLDTGDPKKMCEKDKERLLSNTRKGGDVNDDSENRLLCDCNPSEEPPPRFITPDSYEYMMVCSMMDSWKWCAAMTDHDDNNNNNPTGEEEYDPMICASVMFGQTYGKLGFITDQFRNYDYIEGKSGTIEVKKNDFECEVKIDGEFCQSCEVVQCDNNIDYDTFLGNTEFDGYTAFPNMKVDCRNVKNGNGATYECGKPGDVGDLLDIVDGSYQPSPTPPPLPDPFPTDQTEVPTTYFALDDVSTTTEFNDDDDDVLNSNNNNNITEGILGEDGVTLNNPTNGGIIPDFNVGAQSVSAGSEAKPSTLLMLIVLLSFPPVFILML